MNNFIEINKFSFLCDQKNLLFCKTDYAFSFFEEIQSKKNELVLVIGNSDMSITDLHAEKLPKNVKKVFGQNVITNDPRFEAIPMGLENSTESSLGSKHGVAWGRSINNQKYLLNLKQKTPDEYIYANFRAHTNPHHRNLVSKFCQQSPFITWQNPNLSTDEFYDQVLNHKVIVCPAGNGVDSHRLWETMYLNRVALTIKTGDYKLYSLYEKLPIIILESVESLLDKTLLDSLYADAVKKSFDSAYFNFWKNKIIKSV